MAKGFGQLVLTPQQEPEAELLRKSVLQYFQQLQDPRVERTKDHSLVAIITIAILAVLSVLWRAPPTVKLSRLGWRRF